MVSGDKAIVENQVWKDWAEYVTFNPVTAEDLNDFHGKLLKHSTKKDMCSHQ